jgi:hypothetical protein
MLVGRYSHCSTPNTPSHSELYFWQQSLTRTLRLHGSNGTVHGAASCGTFCEVGGDLYLEDRCWNGRALCGVDLGERTLVVSQQRAEEPAGTELHAGKYIAVVGPAAAFGVGALSSFADRLREQLSEPVVNLGRGAAGPRDFLNAWPSLAPLLSHARAVVIVLMAGRSSANSMFPYMEGKPSGDASMARDMGMRKLVANGDPRVPRLMNESLQTALKEYSQLANHIRHRAALDGRAPPTLLLLWLSECALSRGCTSISEFPQFSGVVMFYVVLLDKNR